MELWCDVHKESLIFGFCCDGVMWIGRFEFLPSSSALVPLESGNHQNQVLKLEPLEICHHRELLLLLGYAVFLIVIGLPAIVLFIYLGKLWIIFLSVVATFF